MRALWRLLRALTHGAHGALVCALVFPFIDPARRMQRVGWWSRGMLEALGITLRADGAAQPGPLLIAANHVSWLDILAINAVQPVRFVSKADVRHWPVLGFMVACGGTLFIERERKRDALRVVHQMAKALQDGDIVAVFPEGTTGEGPSLLPFHANLMQAAVATGTAVQAVALRFSDASSAFSPKAAYVGDTSLLRSLWWVVGAQGLTAHVSMLPAVPAPHADRRALADQLSHAITASLQRR
jgi:1-acyl-sn-glycerol-3-phosphate acyltransferase